MPTGEGFLYLAAERTLQARSAAALSDLLHHSDAAAKMPAPSSVSVSDVCKTTQSMSRKGNCHDNAAMESFEATLKAECFGITLSATCAQAHLMVSDYIETFYNPVRLHSAQGLQSPVDFEKKTIQLIPSNFC